MKRFWKAGIMIVFLILQSLSLRSQIFNDSGILLPGVSGASSNNPQLAFIDIDNDDDLDIILAGGIENGLLNNCFRNDGSGIFTPLYNIPVSWGISSLAWCDYNNDTFIDFAVSGSSPDGKITRIYKNNGNSTFSEQTGIFLEGTTNGSVKWGDYDNDGFQDLVITGYFQAKIYHNNRNNSFTEQPGIKLTAVDRSAAAWGDYDNDGFLDLVITGLDKTNHPSAGLYHNNSNGTFTKITDSNLTPLQEGSAEWGDYDNDGFYDLLLTGRNQNYEFSTVIHKNNGDGTFSGSMDISLPGVAMGSTASSDINNDGKLDIILTGLSNKYEPLTKLFRNDGNSFTEVPVTGLPQVSSSNVIWGDFHNDRISDILIAGHTGVQRATGLFYNANQLFANKPPDKPTGLTASVNGTEVIFNWVAVDHDETPVSSMTYNLRAGTTTEGNNIISSNSKRDGYRRIVSYGNTGMKTSYTLKDLRWGITHYASVQAVDNGFLGGQFSTEIQFTPVAEQTSMLRGRTLSGTSLQLTWKRGNGDGAIIFAKEGNITDHASPTDLTTYFANPEFGGGSPLGSSGWYCIYKGDNDSAIVTGLLPSKNYIFHILEFQGYPGEEVYCRIELPDNCGVFGTGLFTKKTLNDIPGNFDNLYARSIAWGDYNNNGFNDLFISGFTPAGVLETRVYFNREDGTFYQVIPSHSDLPAVDNGFISLADIDNDQDLDMLLSGLDINNLKTVKLFFNDEYIFNETSSIGDLKGVYLGSAKWCDYDNDGDQDVLIFGATGNPSDPQPASTLYRNDNGSFTSVEAGLIGIYWGSAAWFDYDNDGLSDFILSGLIDNNSNRRTLLFRNEGDDNFSEIKNMPFKNLYNGSVDAADYNKDGFIDLLICGEGDWQTGLVTKVYRNVGDGTFTEEPGIILPGITGKSIWCDYDNDGYPDIVLSGKIENVPVSNIFHNNQNGSFTDIGEISIPGGSNDIIYSDYDNDGDIDFVCSGEELVRIYKNNRFFGSGFSSPDSPPAAPRNPESKLIPGGVLLKWYPVPDDETNAEALTYNVKAGTTSSNSDIISPSSLTSGYCTLSEPGNSCSDTFMIVKNLPAGKYSWRVQAVDQAYAGGAWSEISTFEVKNVQTFFSSDEVCHGNPTHFTDQSVAAAGISYWKWDFNDGSVSSDQNPVHTYSQSGTYNVKLVITDTGGTKDSLVQAVVVRPKPLTGFSALSVCQGIPVTATNLTNNNGLTISSWAWDFGDGSTSATEQPAPHPYLSADDYTIKLKAVASNGCADSVSHIVSVGSYPVAAVTANAPLTFCKGDSVKLSVPLVSGYVYNWKLSGTGITGAAKNELIAKGSGSYVAEITNPKGNCTSVSPPASVTVLDAPVAPLILTEGQLVFCQGDSVKLSVGASAGNKYYWKLNGGAVGTDLNTYYAKTSGEYSHTLLNPSGCSAGSVNKITVTVHPKPSVPNISKSGVTTFCEGSGVTLSVPEIAGNSYLWRNQGEPIPGASSGSFTAVSAGTYSLVISNSSGCSVRTEPVNVIVKKAPAIPLLDSTNLTKGKCPGENPVRLTAHNANPDYKYSWFRDGEPLPADTLSSLEFFEAGNYMLRATLEGCTAESKVIKADFPEGLAKPVIHAQGPTLWYLACDNTSAARYMWYFNGKLIEGADKYFYVANYKLGKYQVSIANRDGCYTKSDIISIPPGYTGVDDEDPFNTLVVYPNPSKGGITVEMNNDILGDILIEIFSQSGKKLMSTRFNKTTLIFKASFDLTGQPEGIYVINLSLKKYFAVKKIMIE